MIRISDKQLQQRAVTFSCFYLHGYLIFALWVCSFAECVIDLIGKLLLRSVVSAENKAEVWSV